MKEKNINRFNGKWHFLAIAFGILVFQACKQEKTETFEPDQFIEREKIQLDKLTGPVTPGQVNAARDTFEWYYDRANVDLNTSDIHVRMDSMMIALLTKYESDADSGYVFHYGLSSDEQSIYYIMSPAGYDQANRISNFTAFKADNYYPNEDYHLLLDGNAQDSSYHPINQNQFCEYTERYKNNMNVLYNGFSTPVSSLSNHPYYVFHEGPELDEFYDDYAPVNPSALQIRHCAAPLGGDGYNYHVPVFIFMKQTSGTGRYVGKALDVGDLCPPHCNNDPLGICTP